MWIFYVLSLEFLNLGYFLFFRIWKRILAPYKTKIFTGVLENYAIQNEFQIEVFSVYQGELNYLGIP